MTTNVDARGLSCPQPVLDTMDEIERVKKGKIVVLVDTVAAKENVSRAVTSQGWRVQAVQEEGGGYRITIEKD